VVSLVVLGWLVWRIDWRPIVETLSTVHLGWCLAAFLALQVGQCLSGWRWQILSHPLGFRDSVRRFVALYYVGMFFNLFLPTSMGGDVVKAWYLAGRPGRRWPALVTVFSERFSGLLAMLAIGCLATVPNIEVLPAWGLLATWGGLAGALLGMGMLPLLARRSHRFRLVAEGVGVWRGQVSRALAALGLSFLVQALSIIQVLCVGLALGLPTPLLVYAAAVPLVCLFMMLPISVNGVGVREGSLVLLLASAGVLPAQALALGLVWFSVTIAAGVLGGCVYLFGRYGAELTDPLAQPARDPEHGPVDHHSRQGRTGQFKAAA
jgi:hypothetical protein